MKIFTLIFLIFLCTISVCGGDVFKHDKFPIDPISAQRGISQNNIAHMQYFENVKNDLHLRSHSINPDYINAMLHAPHYCANWSVDTYWNTLYNAYGCTAPESYDGPIPYELRLYGQWPDRKLLYFNHEAISTIMHQPELYAYDNFIQCMQRFLWYEGQVLTLHDKITQKQSWLNALFSSSLSDNARSGIESEYQRIIKKRTQQTFKKEIPKIKSSINEQQRISDIAHNYNLTNADHYDKRAAALQQILDHCCYETQAYELESDVAELLAVHDIDASKFTTNYGNQLQQLIHEECLDILAQTARIPSQSILYGYKTPLTELADASRAYNQDGLIQDAIDVNDFCYAMLDCGSAVLEGVACGLYGAAQDMMDHPIQTVLCICAAEYVLAYQGLKLLTNLTKIGVTYAIDKEKGTQEWNDYIKPITSVINALSTQELSLRDGIKMGTAIGVGMYAQGKALKGLNSVYKVTKANALTFAKKNLRITPAQYMATPEGTIFRKAIQNSTTPPGKQSHNPTHLRPLGKGSTGRTEPKNLLEKLAMEEIMFEPQKGFSIDIRMADPRWPQDAGWVKRGWLFKDPKNPIEIHYVAQCVKNKIVAVDDFKFK